MSDSEMDNIQIYPSEESSWDQVIEKRIREVENAEAKTVSSKEAKRQIYEMYQIDV